MTEIAASNVRITIIIKASLCMLKWKESIRIYHECEGRIDKCVPRITVWHHKACQVMPNVDCKGRLFLSHPHTNNGFFFLLTIKYLVLCFKKGSLKFLNMLRCDMT